MDLDVVVDCSSGTYIRALARDLGDDLGVGGHLTALRRTRVGQLSVGDAVGLDDVSPEKVMDMGSAASLIAPPVEVPAEWAADIAQGRSIPIALAGGLVSVLVGSRLVALYRPDPAEPGRARPEAVFIGPDDVAEITRDKDGI